MTSILNKINKFKTRLQKNLSMKNSQIKSNKSPNKKNKKPILTKTKLCISPLTCDSEKCDLCDTAFIPGQTKIPKKWSKNTNGWICYPCAKVLSETLPCDICGDEVKFPNTFLKVCSNDCCNGNICRSCTKQQYSLSADYKGKIDRSKVMCAFCGFLIDPTCIDVSPFVKYLFSYTEKPYTLLVPDTIANLILSGKHRMWVCDSKICMDTDEKTGFPGIFDAPKLACVDEFKNEEVDKKEKRCCPKCTEYVLTHDLMAYQDLGFIVDSGYPARKCPGCDIIYERHTDTCPRMQCIKCLTNFCHCCGEKFNSFEEVYDHLKTEYQTVHPTMNQIKLFLKNRLQNDIMTVWVDDYLPEDIPFENIIKMFNDKIKNEVEYQDDENKDVDHKDEVEVEVEVEDEDEDEDEDKKYNGDIVFDQKFIKKEHQRFGLETMFGEINIDKTLLPLLKQYRENCPGLSDDELMIMISEDKYQQKEIINKFPEKEEKENIHQIDKSNIFNEKKWEQSVIELINNSCLSHEEAVSILSDKMEIFYEIENH